jgi:hypothetical protein
MCNSYCKFATKIIMFQEALHFKDVISILCYNRQNIIKVNGKVPTLLALHIFQIIMIFFSLVVSACVLNQSNNNWLLFDALQFAITVCLKCKEEVTNLAKLI